MTILPLEMSRDNLFLMTRIQCFVNPAAFCRFCFTLMDPNISVYCSYLQLGSGISRRYLLLLDCHPKLKHSGVSLEDEGEDEVRITQPSFLYLLIRFRIA